MKFAPYTKNYLERIRRLSKYVQWAPNTYPNEDITPRPNHSGHRPRHRLQPTQRLRPQTPNIEDRVREAYRIHTDKTTLGSPYPLSPSRAERCQRSSNPAKSGDISRLFLFFIIRARRV